MQAAVDGEEKREKRMRIYVGGVGQGVAAEDMEKTFSAMGTVSNVEFVARADGRRFAFMDFMPNSDKSVARLFATYNGCIWKGGKLKIEKASEYYMDRLKREWEDAAKTGECIITTKTELPRKSEFTMDAQQKLKIFFPKLSKIKSLPFKGTGRHKYSFQRVDVPPLPVNFCDCEEHCRLYEEAKNTNCAWSDTPNSLISEKELNLMHCVMNKLFDKEAPGYNVREAKMEKVLPALDGRTVEHIHQSSTPQEVQEAHDNNDDGGCSADDGGDDENFVMNIGSREGSATLDSILKGEQKGLEAVKERKRTYEQNVEKKSRKRKKSDRDRCEDAVTNNVQVENASTVEAVELPEASSLDQLKSKPPSSQSQENLEPQPTDVQIKEKPAVDLSSRGASWVQKCSWRDMMGDPSSNSFSISRVLPDIGAARPDRPQSHDKTSKLADKTRGVSFQLHKADLTICEVKSVVQPQEDGAFENIDNASPRIQGKKGGAVETDDNNSMEAFKNDATASVRTKDEKSEAVENSDKNSNTGTTRPNANGNACIFMRSADSQQQWMKAKSAMSRYLKKKRIVNPSANSAESRSKKHGN